MITHEDLDRLMRDDAILQSTPESVAMRERMGFSGTDVVLIADEAQKAFVEDGTMDPAAMFLAGFDLALRALDERRV